MIILITEAWVRIISLTSLKKFQVKIYITWIKHKPWFGLFTFHQLKHTVLKYICLLFLAVLTLLALTFICPKKMFTLKKIK